MTNPTEQISKEMLEYLQTLTENMDNTQKLQLNKH